MQEYRKGQRVKVEFEGVVESVTSSEKGLYVVSQAKESPQACHWVRLDSPDLKVTLLDPADWPPQVGDIWEADGEEWFAGQSEPLGFGELVLTAARTRNWLGPESFKGRNPVLVRRRGQ